MTCAVGTRRSTPHFEYHLVAVNPFSKEGQVEEIPALLQHDPHDILLRDLKDVYVADHMEGANGLPWRRGPEDTSIFLSRENCRHLADADKPFLHVLYHEMAHVIDNAREVSKPSPVQFGRGSDPDDYISRCAYNTNDRREDFAESFAAFWRYRTDPRFDNQDDAGVVGSIMAVDRRKSFRVWNKLEAVPATTEPK